MTEELTSSLDIISALTAMFASTSVSPMFTSWPKYSLNMMVRSACCVFWPPSFHALRSKRCARVVCVRIPSANFLLQ